MAQPVQHSPTLVASAQSASPVQSPSEPPLVAVVALEPVTLVAVAPPEPPLVAFELPVAELSLLEPPLVVALLAEPPTPPLVVAPLVAVLSTEPLVFVPEPVPPEALEVASAPVDSPLSKEVPDDAPQAMTPPTHTKQLAPNSLRSPMSWLAATIVPKHVGRLFQQAHTLLHDSAARGVRSDITADAGYSSTLRRARIKLAGGSVAPVPWVQRP